MKNTFFIAKTSTGHCGGGGFAWGMPTMPLFYTLAVQRLGPRRYWDHAQL
jgi:hypothetical protein